MSAIFPLILRIYRVLIIDEQPDTGFYAFFDAISGRNSLRLKSLYTFASLCSKTARNTASVGGAETTQPTCKIKDQKFD